MAYVTDEESTDLPTDLSVLPTQELFQASVSQCDALELEFDLIASQVPPEQLDPGADLEFFETAEQLDPGTDLRFLETAEQLLAERPQTSGDVANSHLVQPKTDEEMSTLRQQAIPANTKKNTSWALNVWKDWTASRRKVCHPLDCPPHLFLCTPSQLDYWLSKFVMEIRHKDGQPYPPSSLYQICCGVLRYIRELKLSVNLLVDNEYRFYRQTLDAEIKRLRRNDIGTKHKTAEPISVSEEECLWSMGLLGDSSPQILLDTMVFLCGMYFVLRSGQEHSVDN